MRRPIHSLSSPMLTLNLSLSVIGMDDAEMGEVAYDYVSLDPDARLVRYDGHTSMAPGAEGHGKVLEQLSEEHESAGSSSGGESQHHRHAVGNEKAGGCVLNVSRCSCRPLRFSSVAHC